MSAFMFFATLQGRLSVIAAIILALVGLRAWDVSKQRSIGAERVTAQIEKATDDVAKKAKSAGDKSSSGTGWGGVRNPYYRD